MSDHREHEYTQGICQDGAAILKDGLPMTVEEIVEELRLAEAVRSQESGGAVGVACLDSHPLLTNATFRKQQVPVGNKLYTHPSPPVPQRLVEIGRQLLADAKHNDHYTADPIFLVQRKRLVAGIDTDYDPDIGWLDEEGDLIEGDEREALESAYQETLDVPEGYTRTGYVWEWEYVDTYLTPKAAHARADGVPDLRVYVESAYRNSELRAVREFLISLAATPQPEGDGWIKCSHRTPAAGVWVSGLTNTGTVIPAILINNGDSAYFRTAGDELSEGAIVAWKPLPNPPTEGAE